MLSTWQIQWEVQSNMVERFKNAGEAELNALSNLGKTETLPSLDDIKGN